MTVFGTTLGKKHASDTGMAAVLILLISGWYTGQLIWVKIAVPVLIVNMIVPQAFMHLAFVWFGFAHILGMVISRIFLTAVFFLLVFPVGMIRRLAGKDSLQLKMWNKGRGSVMKIRNHWYTADDLEKPF